MILYTNGCSWTYGGGLNLDKPEQTAQRLDSVWPKHLGDLLGTEKVVNLAQGCGSNQRIFRTTLNWLLETPQEELDKTIAVIQWTEPMRFEFYAPHDPNTAFEDINDRWVAVKIDAMLTQFPYEAEEVIPETNRMLQFYTETEGYYKFLVYLEALHSLFTTKNIKYYYWTHGDNFSHLPENKLNLIKKYNWIGHPINKWEYERVSETDGHPGFNGHKHIAEIIYNYIKNDQN